MEDVLVRIKRGVLAERYLFNEKANTGLKAVGLAALDVAEAILNAVAIYKTIRSRRLCRGQRGETLYVVVGTTLTGLPLYTKGKVLIDDEHETYYFLISSPRAE